MTTARVLLVVAGLFTGLLMTILAFFQRALKDLTAPEFALVMQRFLGAVRTHPLHYGLVLTSMLAPGAALVLLRGSAGDPAFILVLVGLVAFVAGAVIVSRFSVEPVYDVLAGRSSRRRRTGEERATGTSASTRYGVSARARPSFFSSPAWPCSSR